MFPECSRHTLALENLNLLFSVSNVMSHQFLKDISLHPLPTPHNPHLTLHFICSLGGLQLTTFGLYHLSSAIADVFHRSCLLYTSLQILSEANHTSKFLFPYPVYFSLLHLLFLHFILTAPQNYVFITLLSICLQVEGQGNEVRCFT